MVGCDNTDRRNGADGGVIDATLVEPVGPPPPNPTVGLEQMQVKGHHRADWNPMAHLDEELHPVPYRGINRNWPTVQMAVENARVFHFGFHFVYQDYRGGARPGYYWGTAESLCEFFPECLSGVADGLAGTGWVGPIVVLFEHFPAPLFEIDEADTYTREELERYGYPYENYIYELEMATDFLTRDRIFAPNDLRGDHPTLRDAVREDGWPSMEELNGKFIFVMIERAELRDVYLAQQWVSRYFYDPADPLSFVVADSPDDDHAAFFSFFGPEQVDAAAAVVEQGFMVHGAAEDPETAQRYEAAGAQLLTVLNLADVSFPGPGQCNPVTAQPGCHEPYDPPEEVEPGGDVAPDGP